MWTPLWTILTYVWRISLLSCAVIVFAVLLCTLLYNVSRPARFERPPARVLAFIDRIVLGAELILGNAACAISCFRHLLHTLFRNREMPPTQSPSPDALLSDIARFSAWSSSRSVGRVLGAGRLDRLVVSIQNASLMRPEQASARLARAIETLSGAISGAASMASSSIPTS